LRGSIGEYMKYPPFEAPAFIFPVDTGS
jgi:hypothetical protein